jgi:hypothetical protein
MTTQLTVDFHGTTYDEARDLERLTAQQGRVFRVWFPNGFQTADSIGRMMERQFGERVKVESVGRQMRYIRERLEATGEWEVEDRDAGGGSKEYGLRRVP